MQGVAALVVVGGGQLVGRLEAWGMAVAAALAHHHLGLLPPLSATRWRSCWQPFLGTPHPHRHCLTAHCSRRSSSHRSHDVPTRCSTHCMTTAATIGPTPPPSIVVGNIIIISSSSLTAGLLLNAHAQFSAHVCKDHVCFVLGLECDKPGAKHAMPLPHRCCHYTHTHSSTAPRMLHAPQSNSLAQRCLSVFTMHVWLCKSYPTISH